MTIAGRGTGQGEEGGFHIAELTPMLVAEPLILPATEILHKHFVSDLCHTEEKVTVLICLNPSATLPGVAEIVTTSKYAGSTAQTKPWQHVVGLSTEPWPQSKAR